MLPFLLCAQNHKNQGEYYEILGLGVIFFHRYPVLFVNINEFTNVGYISKKQFFRSRIFVKRMQYFYVLGTIEKSPYTDP